MQSQQTFQASKIVEIIRSDQRGKTRSGWLDSKHSFSFGGYADRRRMGVGPLRVLNDDWVAPGQGFGAHPHRDMEIISYVLKGALRHQDSGGHGGVIKPDEAQFMRAGNGVTHSEKNDSTAEPVEFLQIWILPENRGSKPAYDQRIVKFQPGKAWTMIASNDGEGIRIDQDAKLLAAKVETAQTLQYDLPVNRQAYVFVIEGSVRIGEEKLGRRDAATLSGGALEILAYPGTHVLLFDLPLWGTPEVTGDVLADEE